MSRRRGPRRARPPVAERLGHLIAVVNASTAVAVAGAGTGRIADALVRAESNLATVPERGIGLYFEPLLLATMARCRLAGGESDGALASGEEAVDVCTPAG